MSADAWSARCNALLLRSGVKFAVLSACALPLAWLLGLALADRLGANPAEALIRGLGDWTLRLLCLTLAVTPLRQAFGLSALVRWRRGFGLWSFAYGCLHLLAWAWLDMGLELQRIASDVTRRPFIAVGMTALALMLPLAATSFDCAMRWLGGRRWRALHRVVYAIALLALLHFFWMRAGKRDYAEVWWYAGLVAVLLGWRVVRRLRAPSR